MGSLRAIGFSAVEPRKSLSCVSPLVPEKKGSCEVLEESQHVLSAFSFPLSQLQTCGGAIL